MLNNLKEILLIISEIDLTVLMAPKPLNFEEEEHKFLKSHDYNPIFIYEEKDIDSKFLRDKLNQVSSIASKLPYDYEQYFLDQSDHISNLIELKDSLGGSNFIDNAKRVFSWELQPVDVSSLNPINSNQDAKVINSNELKSIFQNKLLEYGISNWEIDIIDRLKNEVSILPKKHKVTIPDKFAWSQREVDRLVVHELETHVIRQVNAETQEFNYFASNLVQDYILYEEGLAVYNEILTGSLTTKSFKNYQLRLKLILHAEKSFSEMYSVLDSEEMTNEDKFNLVFRIKRGMGDTSNPGAFPKDSTYLIGYKKIKEASANEDVRFLYSGKVTFREKLFLEHNLLNSNIILPNSYLNHFKSY